MTIDQQWKEQHYDDEKMKNVSCLECQLKENAVMNKE
jgi:hypothetical protein